MASMRFLLVGVTSASLLALPTTATATTPAGIASSQPSTSAATTSSRFNTDVRFLNFDHIRSFAETVRIKGQVVATVNKDTGAVAGVRVSLHRKLSGSSRWVRLDATSTNQRRYPSFTFRTRARANASYRVVFAGNARLQPSRSVTGVRVHRRFNAQLEDGSGRFHGRVVPRYSHRVVYLAKRRCAECSWRTVAHTRTGDRGRYSFKVGAPRSGRYYWRLRTPRSVRYIRSYSGVFTTERR
ncbi:MAG: hypothetical protein H0T14_00360 [Nocardioidaceae bacterium]|nr:hypothetical protein [Nocardioidaceae bacterium]